MKDYCRLVNPYVGSVGHILTATTPVTARPHGMLQFSPMFRPGMNDRWLSDKLYGFPMGCGFVMPCTKDSRDPDELAQTFDHDNETARPDYYSVWLQETGATFEFDCDRHAGMMSVSYAAADAKNGLYVFAPGAQQLEFSGRTLRIQGKYQGAPCFVYCELDCDAADGGLCEFDFNFGLRLSQVQKTKGLRLSVGVGKVRLRFGLSMIDMEQARENLEREIPGWDSDRMREASNREWNALLSRIEVEGGREQDIGMFYSCLYRASLRMINYTEYGRYYSGMDKKIHSTDGHDFYSQDQMWDTYRTAHPLQIILEPEVTADIAESYIRYFEQTGWLHDFPNQRGGSACMIGSHPVAFFADCMVKGIPLDLPRAYAGARYACCEGSLVPWYIGPETWWDKIYRAEGWLPSLEPGEKETLPIVPYERRQSVAVALEQCYDDWCAGLMAEALGKTGDAELFRRRAQNYRNHFNPATGFMHPKNRSGEFIADFDPIYGGGQGARDYYTENNAWTYNFVNQHDVAGFIGLYGSRGAFETKLDRLWVEQYGGEFKSVYLLQFPDGTGMMGNYAAGNEPSFHIPYMYNYSGSPWKTQRKVRDIIRLWYHNHPLGICGDEDGGAMTAWFVFSSMGFYPYCPGRASYDITSPLFERVKIHLQSGNSFEINAPGAAENTYIHAATLNGAPFERTWFTHETLTAGGRLDLKLDRRPSFDWATSPDSAPPSVSSL